MLRKLHLASKLRASNYFEALLLCSAATVVVIRCFSALDYNGSQTMLIAQLLCGLSVMTASIAFFLTFFSRSSNIIAAAGAGIGLGVCIDILEKFITFSNDAFFQPTVSIAYLVSIFVFLLVRHLLSSHQPSARDYLVNSLEMIQDGFVSNNKDREYYEHIEYLLKKAGKKNPPVQYLHQLVQARIRSLPVAVKSHRISKAIEHFYRESREKRIFKYVLAGFFILYCAFNAYYTIQPLFDGSTLPIGDLSAFDLFEFFAAIIIALITLGGLVEMVFSLLHAYRTLELSVYLSLFLLQVFIFSDDQLTGIIGLVLSISTLFVLKYMAKLEEHHMHMHVLGRIKLHNESNAASKNSEILKVR